MHLKTIVLGVAIASPVFLQAQVDFQVAERPVQVHSFVSQGFAYTGRNNFLTMETGKGSGFTDFGVSLSAKVTDRLRVGAQLYDRNIGHLGDWHPILDWAFADYKFSDRFGIRGGKVKTALGLFNETQDMESVHTWAMLPQSVYPLDLRSRNLSHTGVDIYGQLGLRCAGSLGYTLYAGTRPNDTRDGIYYGWGAMGYPNTAFTGKMAGLDLRWNPKITGLMLGGSYAAINDKYKFIDWVNGPEPVAGTLETMTKWIVSSYGEYARGPWRFHGEYRRNLDKYFQVDSNPGQTMPWWYSDKGWFFSGAYQVTSQVEVGTYHSRYYFDVHTIPDPSTHFLRDQVVTLRYTPLKFWSVKVEGHFMNGTGDDWASHGFYTIDNPEGLKPKTNMLVLRTGWSF